MPDDRFVAEPPVASGPPESADSAMKFCRDFAALLDDRGVSLRAAAARSGWGKSTISAARKGPALPNVDLVADVLAAIGEDEQTCGQWRIRHERLRGGAKLSLSAQPGPSAATVDVGAPDHVVDPGNDEADQPVADPADDGQPARTPTPSSRWSRRRRVIAVASAVVVGVATWLLTRSLSPTPSERTIVVQNKVAFGPSDLEEDRSPSYLASRPVARCANVPGCKLPGTDLASGDTVKAVCQLQGALMTNANVQSPGVKNNPNVAASALWYGIRWPDGRRGYLSEVYVASTYRGGLGLPPC